MFWRGLNKLFIELPLKIFDKLKTLPYKDFFVGFWKILVSRKHRLNAARNYVTARIEHWQSRNQLQPEEAEYLLHHLHNDHANDYLSDFGVHIGMKVFVKGVEYLFFPLLYAAGIINEIVLAFLLISGGPISRTVYTSYRMTQAAVEGKEIPWVAFVLGLVPMLIGNIAYPCQMLYSASGKRGKVAKFIVYDTFTRLGDKFPIWGNEDTLTEHFFNYLADKLVRFAGFSRKKFLSPRDANAG